MPDVWGRFYLGHLRHLWYFGGMKTITFTCFCCERVNAVDVVEKDTVPCTGCNRPFDIWEDGTFDLSPIYFAEGRVFYQDNAFHDPGMPSFKTKSNDRG
jgi:hypothetical protein